MYESFYRLSARPFSAVVDPLRYFPAASIDAARQAITRCIERSEGMAVVIGSAGSGKSMLCERLATELRPMVQVVTVVAGGITSRRGLYQALLRGLGLPYRLGEGELRLSLEDHLRHGAEPQRGQVFLIDEAQSLATPLLEELRIVSSMAPQVRMVLFGGHELEERLASPKLESLSQRLAVRSYLQPFDKLETHDYLAARLAACGVKIESLFDADAISRVQFATEGVPRLINQLCDHALLLGFAGGRRRIPAAGIDEAWADLQQLPTPMGAGIAIQSRSEPAADVIEFGSLDDEDAPFTPAVEAVAARPAPDPLEQQTVLEPADMACQQLARIEAHLGRLEAEFDPSQQAPVSPAASGIVFEQEEVVVDRYAKLEQAANQRRRDRTSPPSNAPARQARPELLTVAHDHEEEAAIEDIDSDLIVIEDDPPSVPIRTAVNRPAARRQEYGQLFAKLRRG
ncbi:MAG: AAA family ATPase [Pirellulales bacterium]|nr:AAA family ATPase [Pirellulales bacterium]